MKYVDGWPVWEKPRIGKASPQFWSCWMGEPSEGGRGKTPAAAWRSWINQVTRRGVSEFDEELHQYLATLPDRNPQ